MTNKKIDTIVVATDGSNAGNHAVRYAARLARRQGMKLVIFTAVSYKKVGYWAFIDTHFKKEMEAAGRHALDESLKIVNELGMKAETEMREGEAFPHILITDALAERPGIWILVVGDKGEDLETRHAMGSTATGVLHELAKRGVPVPVLVVPFVPGVDLNAE